MIVLGGVLVLGILVFSLDSPAQIDFGSVTTTPKASSGGTKAEQVLQAPLPTNAKIHRPSTLAKCNESVVTGYFRVPSKFSSEKYDKWMENIMTIQDCMTIFTFAEKVPLIQEMRQHAEDKTVIVEIELDDLPIASIYDDDPGFWQKQLDIDREKSHHKSYQLFWIWLSKTWLVMKAIDLNFFGSEFYHYSDIGCYRNKGFNNRRIIQHPEIVPRESIAWMAHRAPNAPPTPLWNDKFKEKQHYFHSGSQAAGYVEAWKRYHLEFCRMMDAFVAKDMFIGEDQCVLQGTCQQNPDLCVYIKSTEVKDNNYFGLRYALMNGGTYNLWRMPGATKR